MFSILQFWRMLSAPQMSRSAVAGEGHAVEQDVSAVDHAVHVGEGPADDLDPGVGADDEAFAAAVAAIEVFDQDGAGGFAGAVEGADVAKSAENRDVGDDAIGRSWADLSPLLLMRKAVP